MTDEELQSKTVGFLRFPLTVGIVLAHSHYSELTINGVNLMEGGSFPVYAVVSYLFSGILARIAVPLFFILSGFLFFYKMSSFNGPVYWGKIRKRARTLLVPYLFWNWVVIAILFFSQAFLPELMSGNKKLICDYTVADWFWSFWNADRVNPSANNGMEPICYQLWFVRDLMVSVLFSPLIYFLVKKLRHYAVICLGALWLFDDNFFYVAGLNITAFFFFSAGAFFSIHGENFVGKMRSLLSLSAVLYALMTVAELCFREQAWHAYLHRANILAGIVLAVALSAHFIEKGKWKVNPFLSGSSFFVYAFHGMPLALVFKSLFKLIQPHSDGMMLTLYVVSPVIVILSGLFFYYILKKQLPGFTALITGGR